jgi:predicted RNA-binding protein associated with RNAse of E/G family
MALHEGTLIDARARTHRGRRHAVSPLDALVVGDGALYAAGPLPDNPRFGGFERWFLPAQGWVVGRFSTRPGQRPMDCDWYIDIDAVVVEGDSWHARDRLLDLKVFDGRRYEVDDADELADCLADGTLAPADAQAALRSLNALCRALERLGFSVPALLAEYAPGLPQPGPLPLSEPAAHP